MEAELANRFLTTAEATGVKDAAFHITKQCNVTHESVGESSSTYQLTGHTFGSFGRVTHLELDALGTEVGGMTFTIKTGRKGGDPMPAFDLFTLDGEEVIQDFSESDDTVYLMCFWAVDAPIPIEDSMNRLNQMIIDNPGWEGKARIIAINLDSDVEKAKFELEAFAWNKFENMWGGEAGMGCQPVNDMFLRDDDIGFLAHKGKILWRGNPARSTIDEEINALLRDVQFPLEKLLPTALNPMA